MSNLGTWLRAFKSIHERARRGGLQRGENETYQAMREELARALCSAQKILVKQGQSPRQALRVGRALQVDLDLQGGRIRTMTVDLGVGGFDALLAKTATDREPVGFSMKVPGSTTPLVGRVRVLFTKAQPGNVRVSFGFDGLLKEDLEKLEMIIYDTALEALAGAG
jgi:hypothetical protein